MLKINHFSKIYGNGVKAVDDLTLHVEPGDIYAFIGHNGAGKTTTLKACAGILDFSEGEILIDGVSVQDKPVECKRKIAYIPDNPDIYEHLTGIQYLNFISDIFQIAPTTRNERITKYAEMFEIKNNLGDLISSYSHGMKQKLAILSALIHDPKLMLLDEPFVGLDPKATHLLKGIMAQRCAEGGAVFFSTHVLDVAEKLCNKVAIIKKGRLIECGTMEEIKGGGSLEEMFMEVTENNHEN